MVRSRGRSGASLDARLTLVRRSWKTSSERGVWGRGSSLLSGLANGVVRDGGQTADRDRERDQTDRYSESFLCWTTENFTAHSRVRRTVDREYFSYPVNPANGSDNRNPTSLRLTLVAMGTDRSPGGPAVADTGNGVGAVPESPGGANLRIPVCLFMGIRRHAVRGELNRGLESDLPSDTSSGSVIPGVCERRGLLGRRPQCSCAGCV